MRSPVAPALLLAALGAAPRTAAAHAQLDGPTRRTDAMKDGPCGAPGSVRGDDVTTLAPGATITVAWTETVDHPGHYRIAFDDDGQDFEDPVGPDDDFAGVLVDDIADKEGGTYTQEVTLPSIECDACTLQLIQVMTTTAPYGPGDLYFQCADLVLSDAAPDAGPDTGDDDPGTAPSGGCAAGGGATGPFAALALLAVLLVRRRAASRPGSTRPR
jgi:uncharacterized protein (TIGR03382 family)